jgi:4-amino-4-deoxy-L-arabinose transferase-like glycosyltransferase
LPQNIAGYLLGFAILSVGWFVYYFGKKGNYKLSLGLILILSLTVKIYSSLDHYLHEWDERYHALVARHLMEHPLKPTLYENSVEPYEINNWQGNHIWLSKPPLALWTMALSLKVFGISEYSIRIPAIVFSTLSVWLTYLIAIRFTNKKLALLAASLHGMHGLLTDLVAGRLSSDGVEACFLFFAELGFYFVFRKSNGELNWKDYTVIGIATGLAFMSKWHPAFLILVVMFFAHFDRQTLRKHIVGSFLSFFAALIVLAPWCIYSWIQFPEESKMMAIGLFMPFVDPSFNPDGTWYSYLTDFGSFFGYTSFGIVIFFSWKYLRAINFQGIAMLVWALLPLLVFSLAEVKRGTYLFISAPAIFIFISMAVNEFVSGQKGGRIFMQAMTAVSVVSILIYSFEKLYIFNPKPRDREWSERIKSAEYLDGAVVYNEPHSIELMFYHNVTAYPFDQKTITGKK